ncbi:MAG: hypothetical protein ACOX56_04310 [Acholeplasmataceae bacterium]|jgi:protein-S-isoprenylcysteine O-methyltransferase Ste14
MGNLAKRIFIQMAMVLAIICIFTLFIVEPHSAEFYIVIIAGSINCCIVIIGLILRLRGRKKE